MPTNETPSGEERTDGPEAQPPAEPADDAGTIPGENPDSDVLPISPSRRRLAMLIALAFVALILTFLVWFIATHTEQIERGSTTDTGHAEVALRASVWPPATGRVTFPHRPDEQRNSARPGPLRIERIVSDENWRGDRAAAFGRTIGSDPCTAAGDQPVTPYRACAAGAPLLGDDFRRRGPQVAVGRSARAR